MKNLIKNLLVVAIFFNSALSFGADLKTIENQKTALGADISKLEDAYADKVLKEGDTVMLNAQESETHAVYHMVLSVEAIITAIGVGGSAALQSTHTPEMADGSLLQKGYIDNVGDRRILRKEAAQLENLLAELTKSGSNKISYVDLIKHYKHVIANLENSIVALTKVKEFDPAVRKYVAVEIKGGTDYASKLLELEKSAANWTPEKSKELIKIVREQKVFLSKLASKTAPEILPLYRKAVRIQNSKLLLWVTTGVGVISGIVTLVIGNWSFTSTGLKDKSANEIGAELAQKMGEYLALDEKTLELVMQMPMKN